MCLHQLEVRRSEQSKSCLYSIRIAHGEPRLMPRARLSGVLIQYVPPCPSFIIPSNLNPQGGHHYTFEEAKSASPPPEGGSAAADWVECLERARDMALSQSMATNYGGDNGFADMSSQVSSPSSTLGGRGNYSEGFGMGGQGRNHLSKNQASGEDPAPKRNRFSKRQSRNGLGPAF